MRKKRTSLTTPNQISVGEGIVYRFMDRAEQRRAEESYIRRPMTREEYESRFGPYPGGDEPA